MLTVFWSCKGGVGTSVTAALAALGSAARGPSVVVGLDTDVAAGLGVELDENQPGFGQWVQAAADAPGDALERLGTEVAPGLMVVGPGSCCDPAALSVAIPVLRRSATSVVIDAGRVDLDPVAEVLASGADVSLLVVRRCYLTLRRCASSNVSPTGVVVVSERGRALTTGDVERVIGAPVVAEVGIDEGLARTVDAGLLRSRLPRGLLKAFDRVV